MPQALSYPGLYIQEIPSGVRTIAGVSTSDTAFIDFFKKGPVDDPQRITSLGDFERIFGGLDPRSEASYAIQQYFLNGGSIAWVVRVASRDTTSKISTASTASVTLTGAALSVDASSPGTWANERIRVSLPTGAPSDSFNLRAEEVNGNDSTGVVLLTENYFNLNLDPASSRYAPNVVNNASVLIRLRHTNLTNTTLPTGVPAAPANRTTGGDDGDDVPGSNEWRSTSGSDALLGAQDKKTGMYSLDKIAPNVFNLLCIPAAASLETADMQAVYNAAFSFVEEKRAFAIVDVPPDTAFADMDTFISVRGYNTRNAAIYYPRVNIPDPLQGNTPREMAASGTIAGVYARTDSERGVWKAPAGTESSLRNAKVSMKMNDLENGGLNPFGVNALRNFPIYSDVVWGARTLDGADQKASEWKYVPVRRTALFIEESLFQGLKWVVFEPNDEPLWAQIRLNVGSFMNSLFRQGAFQGTTAREAYFVKCDKESTNQNDIDRGIVNIVVGFAPLKPVEFVIIKIQQIAGQLQV